MLLRLLMALFVILNFYSCKKEIYIYEKDLQEDKFYLQYRKSPYTGTCTILSSDSSKRVIGIINYKKGICEGKAIFFHPNGKPKCIGTYHNGNMNGLWKFWDENGNLTHEISYKDDQFHGTFKSYYPSGKIKEKGKYFKNKPIGKWLFFSEDGKIISEKNY